MAATSSQEEMASQASFVFKGTVKKLKAATLPSAPVTDQTTIVHVDKVLQAPKLLSAYEGLDITVQLGKEKKVKEGEQAIFYTNGWLFGDSIAVQSVGHAAVGESDAASIGGSRAATQAKEDRELQEHLADADVVVRGRVVSVGLPEPESGGATKAKAESTSYASEHSPRWNEAIVDVQSVEKGEPAHKHISVRFAGSDDVAWAKSPKLEAGQEGVFILHDAGKDEGVETSKRGASKDDPRQSYVVLHDEDVQPAHSVENIKALIESTASVKASKKNP